MDCLQIEPLSHFFFFNSLNIQNCLMKSVCVYFKALNCILIKGSLLDLQKEERYSLDQHFL